MNKFLILDVNDSRWTEIISSCFQFDFYHTQSYSLLEKEHKPLLCVAYQNNDFIAIPLIIRGIEGTDYYDCTSLYGYCGPVSNLPFESLSEEHIQFFQSQLQDFFKRKRLISAFSRLHPVINQNRVFENFGKINQINKTVVIDLSLTEEEQYKQYRKNHRKNIEKLKEQGFVVSEATTIDEFDNFIRLYHDLMIRLKANQSYFFDREYFYNLLNNPDFKMKLFLAKKDNEIAAGGLFSFCSNIMQAHLTCDNFNYRDKAPVKLVFDHARRIGNEYKMKYLHLGGGWQGSSDDSLFYFKAGFSEKTLMFSGWQLIVEESKYIDLCNKFKVDPAISTNYFPAYRLQDVTKVSF